MNKIKYSMEILWLSGILLIPLVFSHSVTSEALNAYVEIPKIALLRILSASLLCLWIIEWALKSAPSLPRLTPISAIIYLFIVITCLSAILSASPSVSFWGEIPGQDSYALYTMLSYFVIFSIIATHLETRMQLWRLLGCLATTGTIIGAIAIAQHYSGEIRSPATLGNPIFAASIISMTTTISATLACVAYMKKQTALLILLTSAIIVQIGGLYFTFSRGPWIATAVALLILVTYLSWSRSWKLGVLSIAIAISLGVIAWFVPFNSRLASIHEAVSTGDFSNRGSIWDGSLTLMIEHPWPSFETRRFWNLRPWLGYGPDLFRYAYLLVSVHNDGSLLPAEPDSAHNYFLHQGVEQGWLGVISALGVFIIPIITGVWKGKSTQGVYRIILVGLLALVTGRFLEQMVGVARVSDLLIFWVILGIIVALPNVFQKPNKKPISHSWTYWKWALATLIIGIIAMFTWVESINYYRAAALAHEGIESFRQGMPQMSKLKFKQAASLASGVPTYNLLQSEIYVAYLQHPDHDFWPECNQACLATQGHKSAVLAVQQQPLYWRSRIKLARLALAFGQYDEAIYQYRIAIMLVPKSWPLWNQLAQAYIQTNHPDQALAALHKSLQITGQSNNSQKALQLKELASKQLRGSSD